VNLILCESYCLVTVVSHESCVSVSEGAVACENARVCKLKQRVLPHKETRERIERPTGRGRNDKGQYTVYVLMSRSTTNSSCVPKSVHITI